MPSLEKRRGPASAEVVSTSQDNGVSWLSTSGAGPLLRSETLVQTKGRFGASQSSWLEPSFVESLIDWDSPRMSLWVERLASGSPLNSSGHSFAMTAMAPFLAS